MELMRLTPGFVKDVITKALKQSTLWTDEVSQNFNAVYDEVLWKQLVIAGSFPDYFVGRLKTYNDIDVFLHEQYLPGISNLLEFPARYGCSSGSLEKCNSFVSVRTGNINWVFITCKSTSDRITGEDIIALFPHAVTRCYIEYVEAEHPYYTLTETDVTNKSYTFEPETKPDKYPNKHLNNIVIDIRKTTGEYLWDNY